jgi:hypothetical protein
MGVINYSYSVIGDCGNIADGSFIVSLTASSPPLSVVWINPVSGASFSSQTITDYSYGVTGLTAGTYSFEIRDTPYLQNDFNTVPITVIVTSSCTVTLTLQQNTTCGNSNGAMYAYMPINYSVNYVNLYRNGEFLISGATNSNYLNFSNLSEGVYYVTAYDIGGCYGTSNSVIIQPSTPLDFSLYTVNNPACAIQNGQIYITSVSGTGPYSYVWSDDILSSVTGTSVTGLTVGNYGVTVTDSLGCSTTKSTSVANSSPLAVISYTNVLPTCFNTDGSLTFYISGGSSPYSYNLSNGDTQVLISNQVTFSGLNSGNYTLTVTDAGLCQATSEVYLYAPTSFTLISTTKEDVYCNQLGSITTRLEGGTPPFFYSLSASSGSITNRTTSLLTNTFSGLYYGDYVISVRDINSACTYTENITLINNTNFSISVTTNTSTCTNNNGSVTVGIYESFQPNLTYTYYLSSGQRSVQTSATSYTFTGLPTGFYTATVIDNTTCTVTADTFVSTTQPYEVFLYATDCLTGSGGTISALIPENEGPYNLLWSQNVNGQTGIFVTGLTAGTYSLTVSGANNCLTSRSIEVTCNPKQTTSYSFKYSKGVKETIPTTKLTLRNMMYSGYTSLVENATNCSLSSATFNFKVDIGGTEYEFPFYYTESFDNIPDLNYFAPIIESSILTIPNIQSCSVDAEKNTINILAKSDSTTEYYKGETITFTIKIYFVIKCISINDIICT